MASSSAPTDIDLDALIQSLPACKRCRDCRRGCDTLLPKCRQCTKAGVDCIFYDHGRNELFPRSYISELVDHVRRLSAHNNPSPANTSETIHETSMSTATIGVDEVAEQTAERSHYDHHFALAGGEYRYLGAESCLVKSPRLQPARTSQSPDCDEEDKRAVFSEPAIGTHELVELYLKTLQPLYPILDPSLRFLTQQIPEDLEPPEVFSLNMIYSIACHFYPGTIPSYRPSGKLSFAQARFFRYRELGEGFFEKAMEHLEASTVDPSISTLRAVLLLAIHSLFEPKLGNVGQQVALATRLALSLEKQELDTKDRMTIRDMHSTIFSIENELASALDRPATFPEPEWSLTFDPDYPADYLCSLYRLQHRFRKGDESVKRHLPRLDDLGKLPPILRTTLHQTHLLINPCWGSAWHVLEAVVSLGSIHTFLTPHWVFRAGTVLVQNLPSIFEGNLLRLYSNALVVLNLSAGKWPSSASLAASLGDLMTQMKMRWRPIWENRCTEGDVTI
ncbi:hypothetical protein CC78DRAFT_188469 [Lojkania enalia]|uniref:Zn(2)-C6 fungal-type domain-containing protein n=1 Tax=Lojkania enalia TaxID=147567 RepID=A0A9P4TR48_9PLEO|nr:hypothetical protein CC78DRAFT_188469 [Didymosphaeria enalia]